jgi:uncharacterized membrane protein
MASGMETLKNFSVVWTIITFVLLIIVFILLSIGYLNISVGSQTTTSQAMTNRQTVYATSGVPVPQGYGISDEVL